VRRWLKLPLDLIWDHSSDGIGGVGGAATAIGEPPAQKPTWPESIQAEKLDPSAGASSERAPGEPWMGREQLWAPFECPLARSLARQRGRRKQAIRPSSRRARLSASR